jgi:hypothetical protein
LSKELGVRGSSKAGIPILNDLVRNGFTGIASVKCSIILLIAYMLHNLFLNLGRKSGKGVYLYQEGVKGSDRTVNPGFYEIINKYKTSPPATIK